MSKSSRKRTARRQDALRQHLPSIAEHSANLAAGLASGAAAAALPGIPGIVAGALAGVAAAPPVRALFARLVGEVAQRQLSAQQASQIEMMIASAAEHIEARLGAGEQPREDGFFEVGVDGRSAADEVALAVVRIARDEAQAKKLKHYGRLLANVAFDPRVDHETTATLLRVAESLTYRQFCLLALCVDRDPLWPPVTINPVVPVGARTIDEQSVVVELTALETGGLVETDGPHEGILLIDTVHPTPLGWKLHRLLDLESLDAEDRSRVWLMLQPQQPDPDREMLPQEGYVHDLPSDSGEHHERE